MTFATVKELRQDLKHLLERVNAGERVIITRRGKPVAVLGPFDVEVGMQELLLRPFEEAWQEIKTALGQSSPAFPNVEEALVRSRRRVSSK